VERASLDEIRSFHAKLMADASRSYSRSHDQRLERIFELVPREAFFPPRPWMIQLGGSTNYLETLSADPTYLYQNTLVALDADKQINNGTPFLHAARIGAVAPQPGEDIAHIGAGTGLRGSAVPRTRDSFAAAPKMPALCYKRSYLRAKPGNGGLMAPATRNYLTVVKAKFKITGGAGYNSYNPL